jgi:hypothetical protein
MGNILGSAIKQTMFMVIDSQDPDSFRLFSFRIKEQAGVMGHYLSLKHVFYDH